MQLAPPRDSIFDAQEVTGGELGAGFFDDDEVLSNVGSGSDEEELGPLKERRGVGKLKEKGKKAAARKPKGKAASAGAKRKAPAPKGGAAKKARK